MVDGVERFFMKNGKGTGGEGANEEGAKKPWGVSNGDGVDGIEGFAGVFYGFIYDWEDGFEVGAGGDFWDNTTVFGEDVNLGGDNIRKNMAAVFDNGGSGFVARGFNAEDFHEGNYNIFL